MIHSFAEPTESNIQRNITEDVERGLPIAYLGLGFDVLFFGLGGVKV